MIFLRHFLEKWSIQQYILWTEFKLENKTPYELWFDHSPLVKYFEIFGSKCYIKRDDDIGKFDPRNDESIFLGYSLKRKAYRCFNYRTKTIVECANVRIDEKFGTKEKMLEYNFDKEHDNSGIANRNTKIFLETDNDLQNSVEHVEWREE